MNPALPSTVLPSWFDWLTVAAIFLGPILALLAQRGLDLLREKNNRRAQLFIGNRVGYNFSTDYLKRRFYYPTYWGEMETVLLTIRKAAVSALQDGHLNVKVIESPSAPPDRSRPPKIQ